jgi:hypothetical protein
MFFRNEDGSGLVYSAHKEIEKHMNEAIAALYKLSQSSATMVLDINALEREIKEKFSKLQEDNARLILLGRKISVGFVQIPGTAPAQYAGGRTSVIRDVGPAHYGNHYFCIKIAEYGNQWLAVDKETTLSIPTGK